MSKYEYDNGVVLSEPWRYTSDPIWSKERSGWHRFVPAKIEWRGLESAYYKGEQ